MQYPPAAADPVDAGLPDGGMPAAGKGGGRRQATDTLTVKVGYYGMDSSQYVEAGTYHGTELQENLTMYYEAYTFFRPTGGGRLPGGGKQRQQSRDAGEEQSRSGFLPTVKRNDQRMLLLMTGLEALLVAAMGDGAGVLHFKKERDE